MGSDTIKELRTPSVKYREFLALNSEEDVEVYLFEDEVISGTGLTFYSKFFPNKFLLDYHGTVNETLCGFFRSLKTWQ